MKKIFLHFLFLASLGGLLSCEFNDENEVKPSEQIINKGSEWKATNNYGQVIKNTIFLSGRYKKAWVIYQYFMNGNDLTSVIPACSLDNVINLYRDGRYIELEGSTKCDSTFSDVYNSGTWSLIDNGTKVSLSTTIPYPIFEIIELTPYSFKVRYKDGNQNIVELWLKPIYKVR